MKQHEFLRIGFVLFAYVNMVIVGGCVSIGKEKQIQNDIYTLQTRTLKIEEALKNNDGRELLQRMAATEAKLEKINLEIQKIKGEIGALRIGVITGQLPGTDSDQEGSVAGTLNNIITRLETLEVAQTEVLTAINKVSKSPGRVKKRSSKNDSLNSKIELKKAFDKKDYQLIARDAPAVLRKTGKKDKEEVLYLLAESLYKLGKLRDAALKYNDFVDQQSKSAKVAHARMRLGDCFRHLGDANTAKLYYKDVIKYHPQSAEAQKSKERLDSL